MVKVNITATGDLDPTLLPQNEILANHETRIKNLESSPGGGGVSTKGKSFLDFGAVGDGVADDTIPVLAGLRWALDNAQMVLGAGGKYKLTQGILIQSSANVVGAFGIDGQNCQFISTATDGKPVLGFQALHQCRGLRLHDFWIKGSPGCGDGIHLLCDKDAPGTQYLWNFNVIGVQVENCANGIACVGDVFEGVVRDSYFQDNRKNGGYFAHLGAGGSRGVCSAIALENSNFSQNGDAGVRTANDTTGGFDAAYDVRIRGGYMRQNKGPGIAFKNGHAPSASVVGVGFENNWTQYADIAAAEAAGVNTAHIHSSSRIVARDCGFYTQFGGGRWGIFCQSNDKSMISNCAASDDGTNNGKLKLARVDGGGVSLYNASGLVEGSAIKTVVF